MTEVSEDNVKKFDWEYWETEMKSWTYADFKAALETETTPVAAEEGNENERKLVAVQNLEIGTVVAEDSGCIENKTGSHLVTKGQSNCELVSVESVDCPEHPAKQLDKSNKARFLVTTKRVEKGEKLAWFYMLQ